jgi:hypothetical protein
MPTVAVDHLVDDYPDFAEHHSGYAIDPFEGDPGDQELWSVVERRSHS